MGLDYLNKKTWHTGSIKNIEKVWIREQEERDKLKKLEEKKKRLLEERHNEELKKLQAEAGFIPKSHLDRMEWMYDWGNRVQQQQKSAEEFLLGKAIDDESIKKPFIPTQYKEEITNQKCEQYSKLHDDPLYEIRKQEEKLKQDIKDNPFEIRKILQEIENQKNLKKNKKKKDKKKKHKKSKKAIKDNESSSASRSRSREKSEKKLKKKEKKKKRSISSSSSESEDNQDSSQQETKSIHSKKSSTSNISQKSATSEYYENYLKSKLGSVMIQEEDGTIKVDFGLQKRLNKQMSNTSKIDHRPMSEEDKQNQIEEMRKNAKKQAEEKMLQNKKDYASDYQKKTSQKETDPKFLQEMKHQIYNSSKNNEDLNDRIQRNRKNYAKISDESNTFK